MALFLTIIIVIFILIIGVFIGAYTAKLYQPIANRKILEGAIEVIRGKRKNEFDLDGKIIKVNRFIVRDENDKEIIIDLTDIKAKEKEYKKSFMEKIIDKVVKWKKK